MRIVALADSLAMPRSEDGEVVTWEETWPYRLQCGLPAEFGAVEVINCGARRRLVGSIVGQDFSEHVVWKRPDAIVLQVGVVDCAPRIFSLAEQRLLSHRFFPSRIRRMMIARRSARRPERTRKDPLAKVYTPPAAFGRHLEQFGRMVRALPWPIRLLTLPIVVHWPRVEAKSPGYGSNVRRYNEILRQFCAAHQAHWVAVPELTSEATDPSSFLDDGYHLSGEGNRLVASALVTCLLAALRHTGGSPPVRAPALNDGRC
jgi:lysophospholipase L1-like esterase